MLGRRRPIVLRERRASDFATKLRCDVFYRPLILAVTRDIMRGNVNDFGFFFP